jgi:integrase
LPAGPDGKRQRKEHRTQTRAEARDWLDTARGAVAKHRPLPPERLTVGRYLADWLESAKLELRGRTIESYEQIIRVHLAPALGTIKLKDLTPQDVRRYLAAKLASGQSLSSVKYHLAILSRALRQAASDGIIGDNPAAHVAPPRVRREEIQPLSLEQAHRFLAAARSDRLEALFTIALAVGLRQGECLGLAWSDLNLETATLTIRQTVQRIGGKLQFVEPKTAKSRRVLALPAFVVAALREHRTRQLEERLQAGPGWQDYNLVFCTEIGTPLAKENIRRRHWLQLLKRADLPADRIHFHTLRHSCASLLHAQGADLRLISELLGHSTISTTSDVYLHLFAEAKRGAADRMDTAFAQEEGGVSHG